MTSTSPEQRERLLRRALPALAVLVLYFTFVAPQVSDPARAAETQLAAMMSRGIAPEAVPAVRAERDRLREEVDALEQQQALQDDELKAAMDFLKHPDYANQVIEHLSEVFEDHGLKIAEQVRDDQAARAAMPRSLRDLGEWLKRQGSPGGASGWRIRFAGAYGDVARALAELTGQEPPVIPLTLEMRVPEAPGELEWTLIVWI